MRTANRARLALALDEARQETLRQFSAFETGKLEVPYLKIINPPLWELGHVGYFQEFWCLRQGSGEGRRERPGPSLLADADRWFDSSKVAHATRWGLGLPPLDQLKQYLAGVMQRSQERLAQAPDDDEGLYHHRLSMFHEYMHIEAFCYTLQTLGLACHPSLQARQGAGITEGRTVAEGAAGGASALSSSWLRFAAGCSTLGSPAGRGFIFDNEKFEHAVSYEDFQICARPVSAGQFAQFVAAGGYREAGWWDPSYWALLRAEARQLPRYWREQGGGYEQRRFDQWLAVDTGAAMVHVCAREAEAYCRWAGLRLPTELEWQVAAEGAPAFVWGQQCWEWTSSAFEPFAGFSPDDYKEYSEPWFHNHRVVRGASFATPRGMVHSRFRNFYMADRGDPFIGFRVCA